MLLKWEAISVFLRSSSKRNCAIQRKNMRNSEAYYSVTQGCKKVNSSKNGRFRYELIGEMQP